MFQIKDAAPRPAGALGAETHDPGLVGLTGEDAIGGSEIQPAFRDIFGGLVEFDGLADAIDYLVAQGPFDLRLLQDLNRLVEQAPSSRWHQEILEKP